VFLKLGECSTLVNFMLKGLFRSATSFQVHGFENSCYQGYDSIADAKAAWEHACACSVIGNPSPKKKTASSVSIQKFSVSHPGTPTKAPTTPLPSNFSPSNIAPIQPRAMTSPPFWPHTYSNLSSTAVQEPLPQ
jgi:hypothetical protein